MGHIYKAYIFTVVYSLTGVAILCQTLKMMPPISVVLQKL